ncbi:hypothetical protein GWI33_021260 [Rhynchophorus ferrugineus]|uniref:Uncharacterized protein n=1 Tax=Rhynchophorus ferrugineus TaxID=354439 RepID=A0A834HSU1_RHYFE|nr:hypothetical protein GWI33_021260 [Rhynchophorus ferrugineus]
MKCATKPRTKNGGKPTRWSGLLTGQIAGMTIELPRSRLWSSDPGQASPRDSYMKVMTSPFRFAYVKFTDFFFVFCYVVPIGCTNALSVVPFNMIKTSMRQYVF